MTTKASRPFTDLTVSRFSQGAQHHVVAFKEDIRRWLPDFTFFRENLTAPPSLQPGKAKISCSIVNDANQPVVRLAIKAVEEGGWHPLTRMDIKD